MQKDKNWSEYMTKRDAEKAENDKYFWKRAKRQAKKEEREKQKENK